MTTIIRHAIVLSMDPAIGDFADADILIDDGHIVAVGPKLAAAPPSARSIDASGCIVVPGFVDTHRHLWEAVLRGYAPEHSLTDYFVDTLGVVGPALSPADAGVGNLIGARAALVSGVTTVQDISNLQTTPEHTDAMVAALQESGLRAVFGYGLPLPGMQERGCALPADVRRIREEKLFDANALVTMALVTEGGDDDVEKLNAQMARELDLPVARHVSDRMSLRRLADVGVVRAGTTFIHGNGLSDDDLAVISETGGNLSVSPAIEMMMGHGYPMFAAAARHPDLLVTLSADVEVTVPSDMFTQMRAAFASGRSGREVGVPPLGVVDVLRMATIDGATALGLGGRTGSITPGKDADLVVLRADAVDVAPVYDPYSTAVLQMDRRHVDVVMVRGRVEVDGGRSVRDDRSLVRDAEHVAEQLIARGAVARGVVAARR